jgi:hypothetical protein
MMGLADLVRAAPRWSLARLNRRQAELGGACWPALLAYVILYSVPFTYFDLVRPSSNQPVALISILGWAMGYILYVTIMRQAGLFRGGQAGGVGVYFFLGLVSGAAMMIGAVLLLLPGMYLFLRWQLSFPRALAADGAVLSALRWSWERTSDNQVPLGLALLGPCGTLGLAIAAYIFASDLPGVPFEAMIVAGNVGMAVALAWLSVLQIAAYSLEVDGEELSAVFD